MPRRVLFSFIRLVKNREAGLALHQAVQNGTEFFGPHDFFAIGNIPGIQCRGLFYERAVLPFDHAQFEPGE